MSEIRTAAEGGTPCFAEPVPVGQLYFPSWDRYEQAMRGIFERQYYNNNGPVLAEFERQLAAFLGVRHVLCVGNATIGLMMVADALQLRGKVIVPAFTFIASVQSLRWAGLQPVFCDIDPLTQQLDALKLPTLLDDDVQAIMGVNLWGGSCYPGLLEAFAREHGLKLYFDSAHAFGCAVGTRRIGNFGDAEVFSFHATKILSCTEGGCITTNDDRVAARLRSMRPSYDPGLAEPVVRVANARMSEAQAAVGLLNLEDFAANRARNESLHRRYRKQLEGLPGLTVREPTGVTESNYQYLVCQVDSAAFGISRDQLVALLKAENVVARRYFHPGAHRTLPWCDEPASRDADLFHTDAACASTVQLPLGAMVDETTVDRICALLRGFQRARHSAADRRDA